MTFLSPQYLSSPSLLYIGIGGFVAIMALFLPGISGSFILLIMGLYEFILEAAHNPLAHLSVFSSFAIGAVFGVYVISRVITFLFSRNKCETLYFLLGLVIGTLGVPLKRIITESAELTPNTTAYLVLLAAIGAIVVLLPYKKLINRKL